MNAPVYLDYNATTPVAPAVADAIEPCLRQYFGNPSSIHVYGRDAHRGWKGRASSWPQGLAGATSPPRSFSLPRGRYDGKRRARRAAIVARYAHHRRRDRSRGEVFDRRLAKTVVLTRQIAPPADNSC